MAFQVIEHVLSSSLATSGTVNINYPDGYSKGDFLDAFDHKISAAQGNYDAPNDFTITLNASNFTVTWKAAETLSSGTTLRIQLDSPGSASGRVLYRDGNEIPGSAKVEKVYVSLGSPDALDADGLVTSTTPAAGGEQELTLVTNDLDVPRNITVASVGNDSGRTFTVTGEDQFGDAMVEEITGANAGTASGAKAFASVSSITTDDDTAGAITVGWGDVFGLPVFVNRTGDVQRYEDGAAVGTGTLTAGDTATPTATTGDVRGTYAPATPADGDVGFAITIETTDPGYRGADNYAG